MKGMNDNRFSEKSVFHSLRSPKRNEALGKNSNMNRIKQILLSLLKIYDTECCLFFLFMKKNSFKIILATVSALLASINFHPVIY